MITTRRKEKINSKTMKTMKMLENPNKTSMVNRKATVNRSMTRRWSAKMVKIKKTKCIESQEIMQFLKKYTELSVIVKSQRWLGAMPIFKLMIKLYILMHSTHQSMLKIFL